MVIVLVWQPVCVFGAECPLGLCSGHAYAPQNVMKGFCHTRLNCKARYFIHPGWAFAARESISLLNKAKTMIEPEGLLIVGLCVDRHFCTSARCCLADGIQRQPYSQPLLLGSG
jgi:hypothetical protein